jgi:cysteine desulfurase
MIYLDNSATTQMDEAVVEAMLPWMRDHFGNASSIYALGREARVMIENAREEFAHLVGAHPSEIIFTSGGTESNNTALKSACIDSALADRLIVSAIEHHAVLHPAEILAQQGFPLLVLPVTTEGFVEPQCLENDDFSAFIQHGQQAIHAGIPSSSTGSTLTRSAQRTAKGYRRHTNTPRNPTSNTAKLSVLLSVMHANNETGAIQPVQEIAQKLRMLSPSALVHTDAVQAFGKIPLNVYTLGVDFATFSAHKIHGPKGVGALFIRKGIDFKAHQQGGAQERNRRAGTESPALIAGFITAARYAIRELEARSQTMKARTSLLCSLLQSSIPNIRFNSFIPDVSSSHSSGYSTHWLPNIVNISFPDAEQLDGEAILQALDMQSVAVSNGSACVSGSQQPSHVLLAMGRSDSESKAAVRFSVCKDTTDEEIQQAVASLASIIESMRS